MHTKNKGEAPLTLLPVELHEGMNKVVVPTAALSTDILSGCCAVDDLSVENSYRALPNAFMNPTSSSGLRLSRRSRIRSSDSTVSVILNADPEEAGEAKLNLCTCAARKPLSVCTVSIPADC
jgi:hypothetical protein